MDPNIIKQCVRCGSDFLVAREYADGYDHCNDCVAVLRKQQLDAMPKCEACQRKRGTWRVGGVLLCGYCKRRVRQARERQLMRHGSMALMAALMSPPLSRDEILDLASRDEILDLAKQS